MWYNNALIYYLEFMMYNFLYYFNLFSYVNEATTLVNLNGSATQYSKYPCIIGSMVKVILNFS